MIANFKIVTALYTGIFLLLGFCAGTYAQNLESLGKEPPLKLSGGISLNQVLYLSDDSVRSRDPYNWVASGNLNFNIYGWNVPFSYTISNYQNSYQQPFNQYSLHPVYKWIALHVGNCSMNFSPYTLSGHSFLGAGVDLTPPGIFKASIMYGRLLKAIEPDTSNRNTTPAYLRMGYGIKVGVAKQDNSLEFILSKAYDDKHSLKSALADSTLKPQENLVLSLGGKVTVMKGLTWNGEIAGSAITDNINDPGGSGSGAGKLYTATGLFKARSSSVYYKALKTAFSYSFDKSTIGLAYERIDPGYKTLGAYYSNNDYENYTANMSTNLFNKISLSLSAGLQKDDLDHKKTSNTRRFISSVNINYNVNEKLNISTSYSGFQTYTRVKSQFEDINRTSPYQYIDTLNFTQLTNSVNTNVSYNFARNPKKQQYLSFNISYQKASDQQSSRYSNSDFINTNISYAHTLIPLGLTSSASINISDISAPGSKSLTLGPNISVSKNMLKKTLKPTLSISMNRSYSNGSFINSSLISRLMANYTLKKKHNLMASLVFAHTQSKSGQSGSKRNEFTGTMGYSYNF